MSQEAVTPSGDGPESVGHSGRALSSRRRILSRLGSLLWGLSLIGLILGLAANLVLNVMSNATDRGVYSVLSGSMEPTHMTRTTLFIDRNIDRTDIEVGEVITFLIGGGQAPVTHRLVDKTHDDGGQLWYVTRGDNNDADDPNPVHPANVLGVVDTDLDHVLSLPVVGDVPLGQWTTWARTLEGMIALFGPALALFLLDQLRVIFKGVRIFPRRRPKHRAASVEADATDSSTSLHEVEVAADDLQPAPHDTDADKHVVLSA